MGIIESISISLSTKLGDKLEKTEEINSKNGIVGKKVGSIK